jgi:hypothetical protein
MRKHNTIHTKKPQSRTDRHRCKDTDLIRVLAWLLSSCDFREGNRVRINDRFGCRRSGREEGTRINMNGRRHGRFVFGGETLKKEEEEEEEQRRRRKMRKKTTGPTQSFSLAFSRPLLCLSVCLSLPDLP